jgi:hypothetical protein
VPGKKQVGVQLYELASKRGSGKRAGNVPCGFAEDKTNENRGKLILELGMPHPETRDGDAQGKPFRVFPNDVESCNATI